MIGIFAGMLAAMPFATVGRPGGKDQGIGKGLAAVALSFALLHVGAAVAWRMAAQELSAYAAGTVLSFLGGVIVVALRRG